MHSCPECKSDNLNKRGSKYNKTLNVTFQQYFCKDCGKRFNVELPVVNDSYDEVKPSNRYVITSYQANTTVNEKFLASLKMYCKTNSAKLIVLYSGEIDEALSEYVDDDCIVRYNFELADYIRVYAGLNISKTAENPLTGLDGLSKGKTLIVGHPVLQMKTLPVFGDSHPIMITSTGTISAPQYDTSKKSGAKAEFNHSYSAILVEIDQEDTLFHIRVLNGDEDDCFYDLTDYYTPKSVVKSNRVNAIVLGDTHATDNSPEAVRATFTDKNSIVNALKPHVVIHHDLLDFGLMQSHHNAKSFIKRYEKYVSGKDDVKKELDDTVEFLEKNTPSFVDKVYIVSSNHNDHLTVYLDNIDPKYDYKNSKLYHFMMYNILEAIEKGLEVNPFKFYFNTFCQNDEVKSKVSFLGREDTLYIDDILVSSHGDKGAGGSRFSPTQGSKYPSKTITGHSHSPSITKGSYVVGTMTGKQDYTAGTPVSWMNTHCIIHKNGKRQLISIINGKWKL